jgi:hypothetical protein
MSSPRWCGQHGRLECAHLTKRSETCHGPAVRGEAGCRMHLGRRVEDVRREQLTAWAATPDDQGVSPAAAIMGALGITWRRMLLLAAELGQQVEQDAAAGPSGGLVGNTWSANEAAGGVYPTGERARALVDIERAERELVGKLAAQAHAMGVADRQLVFVEACAAWLDDLMSALVRRLGYDPGSEVARLAIAQAMSELSPGDG